jgi:uncharacterized RDD family membrane protein YckC
VNGGSRVARDAGACRRVAAMLLDVGIASAALAFCALLAQRSGVAAALAAGAGHPGWHHAGVAAAIVTSLSLAIVLAWRHQGGTPGALLMGVTVVRAGDGARPGVARALARLLVAVGFAGAGLLWAVGGRPALHDRLTGTRAVLEDEALRPLADYGAPPA